MKSYMTSLFFIFLFSVGCNSSDSPSDDVANLPARDIAGVSYGNDPEQKMDVFLPANRTSATKVIVLIHGGGWSGGSRADFAYAVPWLRAFFPNHAIVNLDYRLGTQQSPGFPKQIEDITKALDYVKASDYQVSDDYALIGASAGAHLAMLYAYEYDQEQQVKAVASIVGPTDFTDPAYVGNPLFQYGLTALVGNASYQSNPEIFIEVSPRTHVTAQSPATIQFNGGQDPLIPVTQQSRLKQKLDEAGVYNEAYLYPQGGHGNWDAVTNADFQAKLVAFLQNHF
ncbi:alpha/beta hydrolase [Flavobacterium selenitireducens]|uniref:alpha/beta hydrolase n=1 Tax=Flavobacterium selenitireducens TaxID=2722704 RepID=UPI00168B1C05|nr:alpha/beta hydrolase [Flavobacterium selenitireducens]MBD3581187.1 alpha/beta hydrolase [Flavobacterium selenitireducens]